MNVNGPEPTEFNPIKKQMKRAEVAGNMLGWNGLEAESQFRPPKDPRNKPGLGKARARTSDSLTAGLYKALGEGAHPLILSPLATGWMLWAVSS